MSRHIMNHVADTSSKDLVDLASGQCWLWSHDKGETWFPCWAQQTEDTVRFEANRPDRGVSFVLPEGVATIAWPYYVQAADHNLMAVRCPSLDKTA